jgi:hypothetical protein
VSLNPDHLSLFGVSSDGFVRTASYSQAAGYWVDWHVVGAQRFPVGTPITAIARGANRFELFGVEEHGLIMTYYADTRLPPPTGWTRVGVGDNALPLKTPIAAVSLNPNHLELFGVARDWAVWHTMVTPSGWLPWEPLPGNGVLPEGTPLTVIARDSNHMDVFGVAQPGTVWTTGYSAASGWRPWWDQVAAGILPVGTPLAAVSRNPNHIDLFGAAIDGRIYESSFDTSTNRWDTWFSIS